MCLRMTKNGSKRRAYKKEKILISAVTVSGSMVLTKIMPRYRNTVSDSKKVFGKREKGKDLNPNDN